MCTKWYTQLNTISFPNESIFCPNISAYYHSVITTIFLAVERANNSAYNRTF